MGPLRWRAQTTPPTLAAFFFAASIELWLLIHVPQGQASVPCWRTLKGQSLVARLRRKMDMASCLPLAAISATR